MISILAGELRTGRVLAEVPATDSSWSLGLRDAGAVDATVKLRGMDPHARTEVLSYLDPARCYLAVVVDVGEDRHVLEAGPIWKHAFDDAKGTLKVGAGGLLTVFDHRKLLRILQSWERPQDTAIVYRNLSLGTIAKRLISTAMDHTGGDLPIVLPPDEAGTATRRYPGYELAWVSDRLQELSDVIGGPDIALTPRMTSDRLAIEWVLRTGTTADPLLHQTGDDWAWDRGAPNGSLTSLSVTRDATDLAHRAWAIGSGTETQLMLGMAADLGPVAAGYPLLEAETSHTSVIEQSTLDGHAAALAAGSRRPWQTWALSVRADLAPRLGEYRPGDWCQVHVPDSHEYLAAGSYRTRILSISGDLGTGVSLTLAPTMEAR